MAKAKTNYTCTECGATATKWTGQCSSCQQWNTMVETLIETGGNNRYSQPQHMALAQTCLLYTSPSPRDRQKSRMPSSA